MKIWTCVSWKFRKICYTKIGWFVISISWANRNYCYLKLTPILDAVVLCNIRQAIHCHIIINKRCIHPIRKCFPIFPLHYIHRVNIKFLSGPKPKSKVNLLCGLWHCNISSCYMRKQSNNEVWKVEQSIFLLVYVIIHLSYEN